MKMGSTEERRRNSEATQRQQLQEHTTCRGWGQRGRRGTQSWAQSCKGWAAASRCWCPSSLLLNPGLHLDPSGRAHRCSCYPGHWGSQKSYWGCVWSCVSVFAFPCLHCMAFIFSFNKHLGGVCYALRAVLDCSDVIVNKMKQN